MFLSFAVDLIKPTDEINFAQIIIIIIILMTWHVT